MSDGHGYNDTKLVWTTRFQVDWQRVTSSQRFKKLVGKELPNEEIGDVIVALQDLCEAEYPNLMAAFHYYTSSDGDMGINLRPLKQT